MGKTSIEWCDFSINPIRARSTAPAIYRAEDVSVGHYCEKISPGCANCYASTLQKRFGMPEFFGFRGTSNTLGVEPYLDDNKLREVLRRKKPTVWFWADMTDAFGWWVRDEWLDKCFATMALTPHHTHLLLTKRPERMAAYIARTGKSIAPLDAAARSMGCSLRFEFDGKQIGLVRWPLPNVYLGISAEDQKRLDERWPILADTRAAGRFISAEPLLGPLAFRFEESEYPAPDAVIFGGESGRGARPCNVEWIRSGVAQCAAAGVAGYVKQLGSRAEVWDSAADGLGGITGGGGDTPWFTGDRKGGDPSEWPSDIVRGNLPWRKAAV